MLGPEITKNLQGSILMGKNNVAIHHQAISKPIAPCQSNKPY